MTNQEAISMIERLISDNVAVGNEKIALDMAIAALKKQESKRPNDIKCDQIITGYCDICGNYINGTDNYCSECGQAINWEGETHD